MPTPAEYRLWGQIGAHESWSRTENRAARTHPARMAMLAKFEKQVDPNDELLPEERRKRAENARKAHYKRMALKSAQVRRRRKGRRQGVDGPGRAPLGGAG